MFKKLTVVMGTVLFSTTLANAAEPKIEAFEAPFHIGETVMACGTLAQTKYFSNRHYLNLDKKHPNQSLTVLV